MKYRFRLSGKPRLPSTRISFRRRRLCLKGRDRLQKKKTDAEAIRLSALFEQASLPSASPSQGKARRPWRLRKKSRLLLWRVKRAVRGSLRAAASRLSAFYQTCSLYARRLSERLRRPPKPRKKKAVHALGVLSGFLCAALLVSALSAGAVLWTLLSPYRRSYISVTVPDFVGKTPASVLSENEGYWNLTIQYEENPDVPEGLVITQSPKAGVLRRIYDEQSYYDVTLVVSRPDEPYTLENLVGMSERDALLTLRNHGLSFTVARTVSDTVPDGRVLQTTPAAGTVLRAGEAVALQISQGAQASMLSVPSLFGMTDAAARSALQSAGFSVGTVSYRSSSYAAGTVIAQASTPHTLLASGSAISYTVSTGDRYFLTSVPDLYGMTTTQAAEALRKYGLVIGERILVSNSASRGAVLMQDPPAGTPITASTFSVKLYIGS